MRSEQLFILLGKIDPKYIKEASARGARAKMLDRIRTIASIAAACFVLAISITIMLQYIPSEYALDYDRYYSSSEQMLTRGSVWVYYEDGGSIRRDYVKLPLSEKNVFETWKHLCGIDADIDLIYCTDNAEDADGYEGYKLTLTADGKDYYLVFSDGIEEYFGDGSKYLESLEKTFEGYLPKHKLISFVIAYGDDTSDEDSSADSDTAPYDTTQDQPDIVLPDYDGYTFTVLSTGAEPYSDFGYAENSTGVVDRAQYAREQAMVSSLNIKFQTIKLVDSNTGTTGKGYNAIYNDYLFGKTNYDMAMVSPYDAAALSYGDLLSDINEIPYINTASSAWDAGSVRDLAVYDSLYYINGWVSAANYYSTNVIYMNNNIDYEQGLGIGFEIESVVSGGKWTFDKLSEYAKRADASSDLNTGFCVSNSSIHAAMQGAGDKVLTPDKDEGYLLTLGEGAAKDAYKKYTDIIFSGMTTITATEKEAIDKFSFGKVLFATGTIQDAKILGQRMEDADEGYLILPYPKLSESQKEYKTSLSMSKAQYICFPKYLYNREMSGIVAQTLCTVGAEVVKPALLAQTLSYIKADSSYSTYILQTIFGSYTHDQGYHLAIADYDITLEQLVSSKSKSYASQMSQLVIRADVQLKNLIDQYKMWR